MGICKNMEGNLVIRDRLTAFRQSQKHQSKLFPAVIFLSFSSSFVLLASLITTADVVVDGVMKKGCLALLPSVSLEDSSGKSFCKPTSASDDASISQLHKSC